MELLDSVIPLFEGASYLGIFILIIVSGYILPVPEELFLIIVGYLVYAGVFPLVPVLVVALLATFVHDQILFYLGKTENERAKWFLERFSQVTMLNHEELVRDHLYRIVFYSRFIPFVRLAGPLLAGSEKVPWKKFALVDAAAVLLYAPLSIGIGYYFHGALELIITKLTFVHHLLSIAAVLFIGLSVGWYIGVKLGLEKKIIAVMPVKSQIWIPFFVLFVLYGAYVVWVRPQALTPQNPADSALFVEKDGRFSFSIPTGFTLRAKSLVYGEEPVVVLARGNDTIPDEIALRILAIGPGQEFEDVLMKDVVYDGSGLSPKSLREFEKKKVGRYEFYFIRSGLFEAQLSAAYYLPKEKEVYVFTLLEDGIVDWMEPSFDMFSTPGHASLIGLLRSFTLR